MHKRYRSMAVSNLAAVLYGKNDLRLVSSKIYCFLKMVLFYFE